MFKKQLVIQSKNLKLHGVSVAPNRSIDKGVIYFHGGGHANAERYSDVQQYLANHGIASLAFSFRGCGKSEGSMATSTLHDRLNDAESAFKYFSKIFGLSESKMYYWGSSMGGHIACRLIHNHLAIRGLILQSAAAYGLEAETVFFGPKFTEIINRPNNWKSSRAFKGLRKYSNPTLIIYGAEDKVIPDGVKKSFCESAVLSHYYEIKGYGHPMLNPPSAIEQKAWLEMLNLTTQFILQA